MIKNTSIFLSKVEDIFSEAGYTLRYEKGNFKAGYCLLKDTKVVIVNKYFNTENRIHCLIDLIKALEIDPKRLSEKSQKLLNEIFN
ncbi:hypothetical protein [Thermoflexibacter ruber]|uniref:Uncharacterized protein n=1 Tax=Thermoflexibacter ruber TaxID=1003 RepID=A0A1I2C021_9BACT|nr:hypothetical protein [Thermoflexibacter ruber]SFE61697.1 hypothetical protein SAMN04488541_100418 [Thermoflexibacter ruber]